MAATEEGHNYRFGPPRGKSGGWPTFGKDGKIVREGEDHRRAEPEPSKVVDLMAALEESLRAERAHPRVRRTEF